MHSRGQYDIADRGKNRGALLIIAPLLIALITLSVVYDPFHMISSSPEAERGFGHSPIWLWVIGVVVLAAVMAYGISKNRRQTPAEAEMTQEATKDLYPREENDRKRNELP